MYQSLRAEAAFNENLLTKKLAPSASNDIEAQGSSSGKVRVGKSKVYGVGVAVFLGLACVVMVVGYQQGFLQELTPCQDNNPARFQSTSVFKVMGDSDNGHASARFINVTKSSVSDPFSLSLLKGVSSVTSCYLKKLYFVLGDQNDSEHQGLYAFDKELHPRYVCELEDSPRMRSITTLAGKGLFGFCESGGIHRFSLEDCKTTNLFANTSRDGEAAFPSMNDPTVNVLHSLVTEKMAYVVTLDNNGGLTVNSLDMDTFETKTLRPQLPRVDGGAGVFIHNDSEVYVSNQGNLYLFPLQSSENSVEATLLESDPRFTSDITWEPLNEFMVFFDWQKERLTTFCPNAKRILYDIPIPMED